MEARTMTDQQKRREGKVAKAIEDKTSQLPSDAFLWASIAAMGASLTLRLLGQKHWSLFIGQWAAPFLLFGIYNKIVKTHGSDMVEKQQQQQLQ